MLPFAVSHEIIRMHYRIREVVSNVCTLEFSKLFINYVTKKEEKRKGKKKKRQKETPTHTHTHTLARTHIHITKERERERD